MLSEVKTGETLGVRFITKKQGWAIGVLGQRRTYSGQLDSILIVRACSAPAMGEGPNEYPHGKRCLATHYIETAGVFATPGDQDGRRSCFRERIFNCFYDLRG